MDPRSRPFVLLAFTVGLSGCGQTATSPTPVAAGASVNAPAGTTAAPGLVRYERHTNWTGTMTVEEGECNYPHGGTWRASVTANLVQVPYTEFRYHVMGTLKYTITGGGGCAVDGEQGMFRADWYTSSPNIASEIGDLSGRTWYKSEHANITFGSVKGSAMRMTFTFHEPADPLGLRDSKVNLSLFLK
jgi:hypothetical protein